MRKINKKQSPELFNSWVNKKPHDLAPNQWYKKLHEEPQTASALRISLSEEQYYLCAYCCCQISGHNSDTMNEHVEARARAPQKALDYTNIVASCKNRNQCDSAHGSKDLPLTPLMPECETEFTFHINGRIRGLTERARTTIQSLNLGNTEKNNRALIAKRKQIIDSILYTKVGPNYKDIISEDEIIVDILIEELSHINSGRLIPFSPAIINAVKEYIKNN